MSKQKLIEQKLSYEKWKRERDAREAKSTDVTEPTPQALTPEQEEKRRRNREKYPEIAEFVDAVREYFPDAKVVSITPYTPEEIEARRRSLATRAPNVTDETDDQQ